MKNLNLNGKFNNDEEKILFDFYAKTADDYDKIHLSQKGEHEIAMHILYGFLEFASIKSILEVGSGTGRFISFIKNKNKNLKILGIEPVEELRRIAYKKGILPSELVEGNGYDLKFEDNSFDAVCSFGVLHHVKFPRKVISEMMRVAKKMIFISDSNNFGQGSYILKKIKQIINFFNLWPLANFLKTRGKGYSISEGDGLSYSYSIFNDIKFIQKKFEIHILNTDKQPILKGNLYSESSHIMLIGIKK